MTKVNQEESVVQTNEILEAAEKKRKIKKIIIGSALAVGTVGLGVAVLKIAKNNQFDIVEEAIKVVDEVELGE